MTIDPGRSGASPSLTRYAHLSISAALLTIALKVGAAWLTKSVGLLSDAMESGVNLAAAVIALFALRAVEKDPDEDYAFGRAKAEYLSAGIEGSLILVAAVSIGAVAVPRVLRPAGIEQLGVGIVVSALAAVVNLAVALVLLRAGRANRSITLEADAKHLMTDVWTSVGVVSGIALVAITHWKILDPIVALAVAANIVFSGFVLIRRSIRGLLDVGLAPQQRRLVEAVLDKHRSFDVEFHALRTRQAGQRSFVSFHVLVPGDQTVAAAHNLVERIEAEIHAAVPLCTIDTHVEPLEDARSYSDFGLDRKRVPEAASGL